MKARQLLLTVLLSAVSVPVTHAAPKRVSEVKPIIVKTQTPTESPDYPRMPISQMIEAWVDDVACLVNVNLNGAGTSVSIDIENTFTSASYHYNVSGTGSFILPINSDSGLWEMTFTLDGGIVYYGAFTL